MANYRRLISYIYAYEGEVKGRNIGFAKLESRSGQCRISVNVKKVYVGGGELEVYLLTPKQEISLGNIFVRSGAGEFRATVSVENVAGSGITMDECFGLTIHERGDSWRCYTTIWEDAVTHAAEVELETVSAKNLEAKDALEGEALEERARKVARELEEEIEREAASGEAIESESALESEMAAESAVEATQSDETGIKIDSGEEFLNQENVPECVSGDREEAIPFYQAQTQDEVCQEREVQRLGNVEVEGIDEKEVRDQSRSLGDIEAEGIGEKATQEEKQSSGDVAVENRSAQISQDERQSLGEANLAAPLQRRAQATPTAPPLRWDQPADRPVEPPYGRDSGILSGVGRLGKNGILPRFGQARPVAVSNISQKRQGEPGVTQNAMMQPGQNALSQQRNANVQPETAQAVTTQPVQSSFSQQRNWGARSDMASNISQTKQNQPGTSQTAVSQPAALPQNWEEFPLGDPSQLKRLEEEERASRKTGQLWDAFRRRCPKVQAFDCSGTSEILVIKPQDIGLLPRETWSYGNNSFLLHGYYNYRYLLLAKVELTTAGVRYLLGVPGHYYSNEKYMASMFGFPHFVLAKRQPEGTGRFGYWYTDIRMEFAE